MKTFNQLKKQYPKLTQACFNDITYLRNRFRWTQELEGKLIILHAKGEPPNMMEFGCTKETGQKLLEEAKRQVTTKLEIKHVSDFSTTA